MAASDDAAVRDKGAEVTEAPATTHAFPMGSAAAEPPADFLNDHHAPSPNAWLSLPVRPPVPEWTAVCRSLLLLFGVGASLALCIWSVSLGGERVVDYALHNELGRRPRTFAVALMFGSGAFAALLGLGLVVVPRTRHSAMIHRLAARLAPLIVSGFVPLLLDWRLWRGHELTMMTLLALLGLSLQPLCRMAFAVDAGMPTSRRGRSRELGVWQAAVARVGTHLRDHRQLPWLTLVAAACGYATYFSICTLQAHYRFATSAFDLGLEDNLVWNAVHGGPLFKMAPLGGPDATHAGYHQTYFAYVIGLVYRFAPGPETLLVVQAVLMAAAAIPLYYIASRRLGRWSGCLIGLAYLLYPLLHGANLYDFHYLPLGVVFLWSAFAFLEVRRDLLAAIAVLLAISVREDVSALLALLGAFMVLSGIRPKAGLVVMLVGGLSFAILKFVVMPRYLDGGQSFVHQYKGLVPSDVHSYGGMLATVFANPFYTIGTLLERDKLLYLLQIFAPLAFLPWRRPIGLLCCLAGFLFTLLATQYPPLIQVSFQYTTYWTTFLFLAVVANLYWFRQRELAGLVDASSRRAWLVTLCVTLFISSYQYGAVLNTKNTRGGFGYYQFGITAQEHERHRQVYTLIDQVPPLAKIVASENLLPHVSSRPDAYTLRVGIFDAEYLLFPLPARSDEAVHARRALLKEGFGVIDIQGTYVLARKGHDRSRNREVYRRL